MGVILSKDFRYCTKAYTWCEIQCKSMNLFNMESSDSDNCMNLPKFGGIRSNIGILYGQINGNKSQIISNFLVRNI